MLRAGYFAQELLSTFSTDLGEVALQPSTGGTFVVTIVASSDASNLRAATVSRVLWDRKTDGGFPETKELKRRVRDVIDPKRSLGHVDKDYGKTSASTAEKEKAEPKVEEKKPAQHLGPRWGPMGGGTEAVAAVGAKVKGEPESTSTTNPLLPKPAPHPAGYNTAPPKPGGFKDTRICEDCEKMSTA